MNVIKTLLILSLLLFLGCATSRDFVRPGTNFNKYQRIAILPLVDFPNHPRSGVQVADIISMRMLTTGATILDRSQTSQLLSEQKLGISGLIAENTAPKIGRILGVQALITGSVNEWQTVCNNVQFVAGAAPAILCTSAAGITLKLIDTETGQIVWAGSARGSTIGVDLQGIAAEKAVEKIVEQQLTVHFRSQIIYPGQPSAEELYNKTISLWDKNSKKYTDPEKVIEYLNQAIRLKPDYAVAYFARGYVYGSLRQHQRAIDDFNETTRLKPDFANTYFYRGYAYVSLGQHQRAIEDYNQTIRLNPDFFDAYSARGSAYAYLGQYNNAREDFNRAIKLNPNYDGTYYDYACLYALQKDATQACNWLERAIERGYKNWKHLEADKDFDSIRNEKCFGDILNKYAR